MRCVIVSDGKKGHENQSVALAEVLELPHLLMRIAPLPGWYEPLSRVVSCVICPRRYPLALRGRVLNRCFAGTGLEQVWSERPGLVISAGTTAAVPALALAGELGARSLHILRPSLMPARCFDALVLPLHDVPSRCPPNAFALPLALGPLSGTAREQSRLELLRRMGRGPAPESSREVVAVLIGGDSLHHHLDPSGVLDYLAALAAFAGETGRGIVLTTSRRTPPELEESLQRLAAEKPEVFTCCVWGRSDDYNPVPAFLDVAAAVMVTADSISMVSECILAGHHPLVYPVETSSAAAKLGRFFDYVYNHGFAGQLSPSEFDAHQWEEALSAPARSREEVYNAVGLPRIASQLRRRLGLGSERSGQ